MNAIAKVGLVIGCVFIGFGVMSWFGAGESWAVQLTEPRREVPDFTAMDAAEVVCFLAKRTLVKSECSFDSLMSRIDVTINMPKKDANKKNAEKICTGMSDTISSITPLFFGRGWTIQVMEMKQGADRPLITCGIR